jgi:DNA-binding CsgD family transcriptional regulator
VAVSVAGHKKKGQGATGMSVKDIASPALGAASSSSASGIVIAPYAMARERRRKSRRSEDRGKHLLAEVGRWFLNCQVQPHLVIDRFQRVLAMNRPAQLLLKSCSSMELIGGNLWFSNPRHGAEMARVLRGDVDRVAFNLASAGGMLNVHIVRIQTSTTIFLLNTSPVSRNHLERLRSEFGLTTAESEIAYSVYSGFSLVRISKDRGASINTVKTQARYVFQKCGVQSQVELTRRIGQVLTRS